MSILRLAIAVVYVLIYFLAVGSGCQNIFTHAVGETDPLPSLETSRKINLALRPGRLERRWGEGERKGGKVTRGRKMRKDRMRERRNRRRRKRV